MTEPLMQFKSHIAGKNADVRIYPDRIEWAQEKSLTNRSPSTEMIPVKNISSVQSVRAGMTMYVVNIITTGNTIGVRAPKATADAMRDLVTQLILGNHPAQQAVQAQQSGAIPPPPGAQPAQWAADPSGRHEHRYFDGAKWTDQVSDGGVQSTDPM